MFWLFLWGCGGEDLQIYVQYLYLCRVVVGEDLQIYVQNFYPGFFLLIAVSYALAFFVVLCRRGFADLCSIFISV